MNLEGDKTIILCLIVCDFSLFLYWIQTPNLVQWLLLKIAMDFNIFLNMFSVG